jgi:transcriptional regulator with XRE-family HTH domain
MKLGKKITRLRLLEGHARGLGRELTQSEVAAGIRELGGQISQSYLSQLESGARPHLTSGTRMLLANFFKVHPGHLVDDPEDVHLPLRPRREVDDQLDLWLIEGSETFAADRALGDALLKIAKHEQSRDCLVVLGQIVENKVLIERLLEQIDHAPSPSRRRRAQ